MVNRKELKYLDKNTAAYSIVLKAEEKAVEIETLQIKPIDIKINKEKKNG